MHCLLCPVILSPLLHGAAHTVAGAQRSKTRRTRAHTRPRLLLWSRSSSGSGGCAHGYVFAGQIHLSSTAPTDVDGFNQCNRGNTCCVPSVDANCPGQLASTVCPPVEFQAFEGSSECQDCDAGKYQASVGSSECVLCVFGKNAAAGSSGCQDCPGGTYLPGTGATSDGSDFI